MRLLERLKRILAFQGGKEEYVKLGEFPKPSSLEEAVAQYPYLKEYLEGQRVKPKYVLSPDEAIAAEGEVNIVYPVGKGIFVHVLTGGEVGRYIIIEPPRPSQDLIDELNLEVAQLVDEKTEIPDEIKEETLEKLFNAAVRRVRRRLSGEDKRLLLYYFMRERLGYGFLEGFLQDDWLEDISVPGAGNIFVYHKVFGPLETNVRITEEEIDDFLGTIAERHGKMLSYENPILDVHLADGSRFNIVFGRDISLKGSNFTIRKFSRDPISIARLIKWKTISAEAAAYLWMLLEVGVSAFICGETASGKTTTLNAATAFIRPDAKIVSIEETPEVNLFHKNWVREVTRLHKGAEVTMFDLVKAALRQRPDYIIVGEIRGEEGRIAFQAIETGHPVLSTMHAGNMAQLFQRLTSYPINVPKTHIDSLNLVVFQARIEKGNRLIRRVTSINEILGYNAEEGKVSFMPSYIYDFDRDSMAFTGSSLLLEYKVLPARGWGRDRLLELYEELRKRARILEYLAENYPRYEHVFKTVTEANRKGVDYVYDRVIRGERPWSE
ncbi:MAG: flagellar protein FlaI [Thermoprotei archaeon]|nr:MAG: flagellar protein FlaI [Thermoprotei archaeon]